jgi:hypothetical protein
VLGDHARHQRSLPVADVVQGFGAEVADPGALDRGIVGRRRELRIVLQRVVDPQQLRIVVVEVLDAPGPVGADHVLTQQPQEGRHHGQVREDDPRPHLLAG